MACGQVQLPNPPAGEAPPQLPQQLARHLSGAAQADELINFDQCRWEDAACWQGLAFALIDPVVR